MRRPLVLQLTPLLDLLLIVVFAQYISLQVASLKAIEQEGKSRVEAEARKSAAEGLRDNALEGIEKQSARIRELEREKTRLEQQLAGATVSVSELEKDIESIGGELSRMLDIPAEDLTAPLERALKHMPAIRAKQIVQTLQTMGRASPQAVVEYLVENAELRQHVDIWEVHVDSDDSLRVTYGQEVIAAGLIFNTADDLAAELTQFVKDQGRPQSLVFIFFTYSNAHKGAVEQTKQGLESARKLLTAFYPESRFHTARGRYSKEPP